MPDELWFPRRRLCLLKVWRLARVGLSPREVARRLGVSEAAVRRSLEELERYAVSPGKACGDGWVRCYYISPEELSVYGPVRRAPARPGVPARRPGRKDGALERERAGE